ncbi:Small, acid-soluble spore protein C [compost metagenome]|uniref:Spore protein n=1 Tax=Paenibacillus stellifer TaxID=169760 RepID=A0A089LW27_9BACL|nr:MULTISPECIES: alpha/beta-type small acid-soluble spore protein [Paenibacillus]AIQ63398.1 spore protein [Paenibacillus stellifer]MBY9080318.1 alpha/beta-type small acid-soluble spore protein [Paenibacillus sp. CGMCC 1.18879]MBY9083023.1 alpha/beta-type small acid-soluble spore protein [Paenibacillus sinensis]
MAQASNGSSSTNNLVVPKANAALEQLKYEVAQELGITLSPDGYQGNKTSYENGSIGGYITKRLVTLAEQQLAGQFQ